MVLGLFKKSRHEDQIEPLYTAIVNAARAPHHYLSNGVPDTVNGRFEMLSLHVVMVIRRLNMLPAPAADVSQDLVNRLFADLDASLREIGIGDITVPKKINQLGEAFYGRARAYDAAFTKDDSGRSLAEALARNVLGKTYPDSHADSLAVEVRAFAENLSTMSLAELLSGPSFGGSMAAR